MPPMTQDPRRGRSSRRLTATVTDLEVVRQNAFLVGLARNSQEAAEAETRPARVGPPHRHCR